LATPGNHDDPGLLAGAFATGADPACWSSDVGAWRIVLLSSAHHGSQGGAFGAAALAGLERELATDRPVLVATHHPPRSWCPDPDCVVEDADAFAALVGGRGNVVAVVSGHLHLAAEAVHDGVTYLSGPSTCLQLDHVHPLPDHNHAATPIGARAIELRDDGSLHWELRWLPPPA
jgi:Icc protein